MRSFKGGVTAAPELISTFLFRVIFRPVQFGFAQSSATEFISAFWFSAAGMIVLCSSPWGKGLVWCSSQLFGSVLLGCSESQTGCCGKSRAQSKIGASPAANKCFKFGRFAPPTSLTLGGLSRRYALIRFCSTILNPRMGKSSYCFI